MNEGEIAEPSSMESAQATERGKKGRLFWRLYALFVIGTFLLLPIGSCSYFFWLPDAIPPHEWMYVGGVALPNAQELHMFQKWGYDFYTTVIAFKEENQTTKFFFVDGDDCKQWRFNVQLDLRRGQATVKLNPEEEFTYHWADGHRFEDDCPWPAFTAEELKSEPGALPTLDAAALSRN